MPQKYLFIFASSSITGINVTCFRCVGILPLDWGRLNTGWGGENRFPPPPEEVWAKRTLGAVLLSSSIFWRSSCACAIVSLQVGYSTSIPYVLFVHVQYLLFHSDSLYFVLFVHYICVWLFFASMGGGKRRFHGYFCIFLLLHITNFLFLISLSWAILCW